MRFPISLPILPLAIPSSPTLSRTTTNCSIPSTNTTFRLTFLSHGIWTALPSQYDNPTQNLESVSFAVANAANGVETVCAFSVSGDSTNGRFLSNMRHDDDDGLAGVGETLSGQKQTDTTWQPCADRKDTDGKHRFTITTSATVGRGVKDLALNQTWFCHDDVGRLVAFTGVATTPLDMTCSESEVSGYHLRNCTSPDLVLPVTLL